MPKASSKKAATAGVSFSITLHHTKSTKGTHVFTAEDDANMESSIPSLYIRKTAFEDGDPPRSITVTVEG